MDENSTNPTDYPVIDECRGAGEGPQTQRPRIPPLRPYGAGVDSDGYAISPSPTHLHSLTAQIEAAIDALAAEWGLV